MELINNVKNKSFIILSIVLVLFFFVFQSSVLGAEGMTFKYQDEEYTLPILNNENFDSNKDLILLGYSSKSDFRSFGIIVLKDAISYINDGCRIETVSSGRYYFSAHKLGDEHYSKNIDFYFFKYWDIDGCWGQWGNLYSNSQTTDACDTSNFDFIYCQCDLYNFDGDILFHGAPSSSIASFSLTGAEQIPQAMVGVVKIVLPVGLGILGLGLVILLIKSVIYRMR